MQTNLLDNFKKMCQELPFLKDQSKDICEKNISDFLKESNN